MKTMSIRNNILRCDADDFQNDSIFIVWNISGASHVKTGSAIYRGFLASFSTVQCSSVQLLSHVWLSVTPWTAACQASLSIINSQSLLKLMSIESVMPSNHLIFCRPLLLPPSIFPSISVFSNESVLRIKWPKYWSFSFSMSPSNEHPGPSPLDGLVGSPCSPRDSQESFPVSQFKSTNSLLLSFLYSPTLTSIHDYWKNHSFD